VHVRALPSCEHRRLSAEGASIEGEEGRLMRQQCRATHPETRARCERNTELVGKRWYPHEGKHRAEVGEPDATGLGRIVEW
jgi:hypothetical protein